MKTACRILAIIALVSLAATFVLIGKYGYLLGGVFDGSDDTQRFYLFFAPLFTIVAATSSALSFASGVVGAVMAGQRRQRVWFVALLLTLVFATYAGIAIIMIPALTQFFYIVEPIQGLSDSTNNPLLRLEMVNYVITPLLAPLVALIYSLRARRAAASRSRNLRRRSGHRRA